MVLMFLLTTDTPRYNETSTCCQVLCATNHTGGYAIYAISTTLSILASGTLTIYAALALITALGFVKLRSEVHEKPLETQHYGLLLHDIVTSNRTLYNKIVQLNNLDMELYQYALDLFSERVTYIGIKIDRNKLDCKIKSFNQLLI